VGRTLGLRKYGLPLPAAVITAGAMIFCYFAGFGVAICVQLGDEWSICKTVDD